jgi:hypothetical protein
MTRRSPRRAIRNSTGKSRTDRDADWAERIEVPGTVLHDAYGKSKPTEPYLEPDDGKPGPSRCCHERTLGEQCSQDLKHGEYQPRCSALVPEFMHRSKL